MLLYVLLTFIKQVYVNVSSSPLFPKQLFRQNYFLSIFTLLKGAIIDMETASCFFYSVFVVLGICQNIYFIIYHDNFPSFFYH
jgi:hypothetical protein